MDFNRLFFCGNLTHTLTKLPTHWKEQSLICLFCSFQDLDGHLFTIYASLTNTTKMSSPRIWLMAVLTVIFLSGVFAPYPPGHPNAFLNPLIIPWWIYTPCSMRKAIHVIATGTPLPPDGCIKYRFRSRRPQVQRRDNFF